MFKGGKLDWKHFRDGMAYKTLIETNSLNEFEWNLARVTGEGTVT